MRLIDADELTKKVYAWAEDEWNAELLPYWVKEDIEVMIESAPTIDPIKHGHWEFAFLLYGTVKISKCSVCEHLDDLESNYCPRCGAKMDEVNE